MLFCPRVIIMTLYERIRQLRIDAGMSQDDLAKAMGYSDRSMITKIESGKVDISQKKILAFARILNTTPGYLMGWSDDQPAEQPYTPKTLEARSLAKGMDTMPEARRKAIMEFMISMAPDIFKEGNENDDT